MSRGDRSRTGGPRRLSLSRDPVRPRAAASPAAGEAPRPAPVVLPPDLVLLGEFGRPHGLAGEIRLKSHTGDPKAVASYGPLTGQDGRSYVIKHLRQAAGDQRDMLVARVEGVETREAAERLNRLSVHVPREKLGEPEEDEFFLADLIGLRVEGPAGEVGRVLSVPDYGSGELLEIAVPGRRQSVLLPFTKAFVPQIDIAGGRVVIAPPEDWLDEGQLDEGLPDEGKDRENDGGERPDGR